MRKDIEYKFNLMNLMKTKSLYSSGLQPIIYSTTLAKTKEIGWFRAGKDISYFRTAPSEKAAKTQLFTLSFTINFPCDDDCVYIAHCYPYTYSKLQTYISQLKSDPYTSEHVRHRVLCRTNIGNNIDLLSITKKVTNPDELAKRKGIVVTGRVHPGETNSSWMMQGFIDFIVGSSDEAVYLRENFVFKIIPMLNPDGVIVGNYRCNLSGYDLNRQWSLEETGKLLAPEIWHTKNLILEFSKSRELIMYCDLHGHSRKHGVFLYGCHNNNDEEMKYLERVFPYMLSLNEQANFVFKRCQFEYQRRKEGTSRVSP